MVKFFKKRKKLFIICGFCALLVIAGVLNLVLNNSASNIASSENVATTGNFFTTYKSDRLSTQEQEKLYLEAILNNENTSAEAKSNAEKELLSLATYSKLQSNLEGLITAKGFAECVVSASENNISVIVKANTLSSTEVAQIVDVIQNNSNYGIENIKIIPVE